MSPPPVSYIVVRIAKLGGECLYHCFVCEFVVSFDRIIPDPREEGEESQKVEERVSRDRRQVPLVMSWRCSVSHTKKDKKHQRITTLAQKSFNS